MIKFLSFIFLYACLATTWVYADDNPFGTLGTPLEGAEGDPTDVVSGIYSGGLMIFLFIAFLAALAYGLWGGMDWVTSGGESDKLKKAQSKITQAVIGVILIFVVFVIYNVVVIDVLNVFEKGADGNTQFNIPTVKDKK